MRVGGVAGLELAGQHVDGPQRALGPVRGGVVAPVHVGGAAGESAAAELVVLESVEVGVQAAAASCPCAGERRIPWDRQSRRGGMVEVELKLTLLLFLGLVQDPIRVRIRRRRGRVQRSRSTRMVSRSVPNVRTPKLLNCGSSRSRACGSSSGTRCAVPLCHRPRSRTRTRGSALMLRTYCDRSPNSETNQNSLADELARPTACGAAHRTCVPSSRGASGRDSVASSGWPRASGRSW